MFNYITPDILVWCILFAGTLLYVKFWFNVAQSFRTEVAVPAKIEKNQIEVICVFRNEENALPLLLNSLQNLIIAHPVCVRLINDHSTDSSTQVITKHPIFQLPQFKLLTPPDNVQTKKHCLDWAIRKSSATHIWVTDADCHFLPDNLAILWGIHQRTKASLTLGLVDFSGNNDLLEQYQIIENTGLVALSVYHAKHNRLSMGNAANMLINRNDFIEAAPYKDNLPVPGGDEIYLILKLQEQHKTIAYANSSNAIVTTPVLNNWSQLWHQRIRWAKKSSSHTFTQTQKSQILFVIYYYFLWGMTIYGGLKGLYALPLLCWMVKMLGEFLFIKLLFKHHPKTPTLVRCIQSSIVQSIFVPVLAVSQFTSKVHWKNRRYA